MNAASGSIIIIIFVATVSRVIIIIFVATGADNIFCIFETLVSFQRYYRWMRGQISTC